MNSLKLKQHRRQKRHDKQQWKKQAFKEIFEAAAALDGTLSGEHGIGLAKAQFMPLVMDEASREFLKLVKNAVDPTNILNPGKFV